MLFVFGVQDLSVMQSVESKRQRRVKHKQKSFRLGDDDEEAEYVDPLTNSFDHTENNKFHKRATLRNYLESIKEEESRSREEESNLYSIHYKKKGGDLDGSSLDLSKV